MTHSLSAALSLTLLLMGCAPPTTAPSLVEEDPQVAEADAPSDDDPSDDDLTADTGWDTGGDTGWGGTPLPPAACSKSSCDGQDPVAMGCTGLTTLANGTNGGVTWAVRYSSVCKATFVRAWRHSTAGYVQARIYRQSDLFNYMVNEPSLAVLDKRDSGMVYCPSGSCTAMACVRDSATSSYTCTGWL